MKKNPKIILLSFFALVVLFLLVLHITYHSFSPADKGVQIREDNLVYFQDSYEECRQAFLSQAEIVTKKYNGSKLFSIKVPGKTDTALYIDLLYIPPADDSMRLLVISSGIHGIEGFTGSAVQQMFLGELLGRELLECFGVLLIHGINPYGFKYLRRFTENNVDLNRGAETDSSLFCTKNPNYTELYDLLNPVGEASMSDLRNQFFYYFALKEILMHSMIKLKKIFAQGQYEYSEGIFFGGKDFEPQIDSLREILPKYLCCFDTIIAIDLHTGHGKRGLLHLLSAPLVNPAEKARTESMFEGRTIIWGDPEGYYTNTGCFSDSFLGNLCPESIYLHMEFEWGTYDLHKTFGNLKRIQTLILENQGFHYGYSNPGQKEKITKQMLEQYYPSSIAWRSETIVTAKDMLLHVLMKNSAEQ